MKKISQKQSEKWREKGLKREAGLDANAKEGLGGHGAGYYAAPKPKPLKKNRKKRR